MNVESVLSNKYESPLVYEGRSYPSAENAFQATRFAQDRLKRRYAMMAPYEAEYRGARSRDTMSGWDARKYDLMYSVLRAKFSDPDIRKALLDTEGDIRIENLNHEHGWGVCVCSKCRGKGSNNLGRLLMRLRDELRKEMR